MTGAATVVRTHFFLPLSKRVNCTLENDTVSRTEKKTHVGYLGYFFVVVARNHLFRRLAAGFLFYLFINVTATAVAGTRELVILMQAQ